jgi:hypothetical protein
MHLAKNLLAAVSFLSLAFGGAATTAVQGQDPRDARYFDVLDVTPQPISSDKSINYDYDIVYVRAPRRGDEGRTYWTEVFHPARMDAGADLMLLHPDGSEEVLVKAGENESITDPFVSFDGEWVYYARFHDLSKMVTNQVPAGGSDIYKIHVPSRKIVQLTHGKYTPNTGAADWSSDFVTGEPGKTHMPYGVYNLGPCPLPGGRLIFTSNRNAFDPPKGYSAPTLQLFVMDDDGKNVELIGHLNIGSALHPTILRDGRVMFTSFESQGLRDQRIWGIWTIHPDGANWAPLVSAFRRVSAFHFMTQLSDGNLIVEEYYNLNNSGFGTYWRLPERPAEGHTAFGPADVSDPRNKPSRVGRFSNGKPKLVSIPFSPDGIETLTPFVSAADREAEPSVVDDKNSPRVGKFTHPSGAPDNHLLTVWSPGPANHNGRHLPMIDGGIYLIKDGRPLDEPGKMLLIKNDPKYNEQWPRALVPYERTYGVKQPRKLKPLANDGHLSPHLPEGTPFGLVGTSSLYKRESYPGGGVPEGQVTAQYVGDDPREVIRRGLDSFNGNERNGNWTSQGADAGLYSNSQIHAIRILAMEPTTDRRNGPVSGRGFHNHANERLRILGEIPVRKFTGEGTQPTDPDGNPDTSFLARIPADVAWTFQTLDRHGMVLNASQTWHQLRPGEIRNNCGGCHAHSQQPTLFEETAAARPEYEIFDLTKTTPLVTSKAADESGRQWDNDDESGLRFENAGVVNVEYHRDIKPILHRSCVACHTEEDSRKPAGNLVLDDDEPMDAVGYFRIGAVPGTYYRLAMDSGNGGRGPQFGHQPLNRGWRQQNASRYIRKFQSRRSLLAWKIFGRRMDGWSNEDFPTETSPGDPSTLKHRGSRLEPDKFAIFSADLDYTGSIMPPPAAVKSGKVEPLSDEDRRTIVRWIDLGCPIDLDYDAKQPERRGFGWMCDDKRPTLTLTYPRRGENASLERILIGAFDYYSGLEPDSLRVVADFAIDGVAAGEELAGKFREKSPGVWQWKLAEPMAALPGGTLTVSIKDRQGNITQIERTFSVAGE